MSRRRGSPSPWIALAAAASLAACGPVGRTLRGYADTESSTLAEAWSAVRLGGAAEKGRVRFLLDDFGTLDTDLLETYGFPWKLVVAALALEGQDAGGAPRSPEAPDPAAPAAPAATGMDAAAVDEVLARYGLLTGGRIANGGHDPLPRPGRPVGVLTGVASRSRPSVEVEVAGVGCALCHAGRLWDEHGRPSDEVWLGVPNASLDVAALQDDATTALRKAVERPEALLRAVRTLFPEVGARELSTLERHAIPRARKRLEEIPRGRSTLPFPNGGPGMTNGVGSLRFVLGMPGEEALRAPAFVSIPFLGDRVLKSALLVDGTYAPPGRERFAPIGRDELGEAHLDELAPLVAFFIVPALGGTPGQATHAVPAVREVVEYLASVRPPPFPGPVDSALALGGRQVYARACAGCHGRTTPGLADVRVLSLPNRLVPQDSLGTDPERWRGVDPVALARLDAGDFGSRIEPARTGGYVAPPLSGLWASAPYLHNGSVPTLWHLMHPEARPERFQVGGHGLDLERVGVDGRLAPDGLYRYPKGYRPWSRPFVFDTGEPGRSNRGHERPFAELSEAEKRALLEYLKLL